MTNALDTLRAPAQKAPDNFPAMLKAYSAEISRALPKHMNGDRLARIALTEFRKNPTLGKCTPTSVFASVIMASQLGLEFGINGQCFMVPYFDKKNNRHECQFIPGWKGMMDLLNRTGRATAWTAAVYEGDEFDWGIGDRPFVNHKPCGEDDPRKLTHVYAVGRVNGAEWPYVDVWSMKKIWRHRDKHNKVGDRHYSFRYPEMYARKIVLLQILKYLPSSVEISQAMELEYAAGQGQNLNAMDVIEGTYAPIYESDDEMPEITTAETEPPKAESPAEPELLTPDDAKEKKAK